jgi:ketosteroid isomerase-like protein
MGAGARYSVAMSQENVGVVRRAFAEFERGNFWMPELFDPAIRIRWLDAVGAQAETVGLQAISSFLLNWLESWDELALAAERIIDAGDRVVAFCAWRGRGKTSGVKTEWRHGEVWTLREERVISIVAYHEPADALEAVGLLE